MSVQIAASLVDFLSVIAVGVWMALYGFQVVGKKPGDPKYERNHAAFGKHFRWLGPLIVAFQLVRMGLWIAGMSR